jgi:hypothetical protein
MLSVLEVHEPDEPFTLLGKHKGATPNEYPSLTATGDLSPGSTVTVDLVDAVPGKKVWLVLGDYPARRPLKGGELVPGVSPLYVMNPFFFVKAGTADANGRFTWNLALWNTFPSGTEFYLQAASRDPAAEGRLAFSNALMFTKP